jgi:hypothetical protein
MPEFSDKEFRKLLLNVQAHNKDADIFRLFPILNKYPIFHSDCKLNINYVIRYIVFAFDRNSPLNSIDEIAERRIKAASLAGFSVNDKGQFSPVTANMIKGKNQVVNLMIIQFCIMLGDDEWTALIAFQEAFKNQVEKLMSGDDTEKTKEVRANVSNLKEDIRTTKEKLLNKNMDSLLEADLYTYTESKKLMISPEEYASLFSGEEVVTGEV